MPKLEEVTTMLGLRQRESHRTGEEREALTQPQLAAVAENLQQAIGDEIVQAIDIEGETVTGATTTITVKTSAFTDYCSYRDMVLATQREVFMGREGISIGVSGAATDQNALHVHVTNALKPGDVWMVSPTVPRNVDFAIGSDSTAVQSYCYRYMTDTWYAYSMEYNCKSYENYLLQHLDERTAVPARTPEQEQEFQRVLATQRANHETRMRELREEQERQKLEAAKADATARELFINSLTDFERTEFERTKAVTVIAPSGKAYRVLTTFRSGYHGNVVELDTAGRPAFSLCCAPGGVIPKFDKFLGQLLALKYDEKDFVRAANRTKITAGYEAYYEPPRAHEQLALAA